jgi:succinate---hydroxymethylglutarate CoA-transferase
MSLYYASINRNKRSITLNLKNPTAVEIIKSLACKSDILVHNFLPGKMEKIGLDYSSLEKLNPGLIYASISGYGSTGPSSRRAGYDAIALAETGLLHITGEPNGPPTKPGVAIGDMCTGLYAHGAILSALELRRRTGLGTQIEGSLFESSLSLLINVGLASLNLDVDNPDGRRRGSRHGLGHPNLVPYGGFETKDRRMIFIAANNNRQWEVLSSRMSLSKDQIYGTNDGRVENRESLNSMLQSVFLKRTLTEWLSIFEGSGLPYGALNDVVDALDHPQTSAREMIEVVENFEPAVDGFVKLLGFPIKFSNSKLQVTKNPPLLGEHTEEILTDLGYDASDIAILRRGRVI